MRASSPEPGSRYLASRLRTLYDVCRDGGRDDDGRACATCPVADICARDLAQARGIGVESEDRQAA
jgi:hypothetical protein